MIMDIKGMDCAHCVAVFARGHTSLQHACYESEGFSFERWAGFCGLNGAGGDYRKMASITAETNLQINGCRDVVDIHGTCILTQFRLRMVCK